MPIGSLKHLLRVLDERDIPLGHDDVAWAFESAKESADVRRWVREYLHPATLLTKEERTFSERVADATTKDRTIKSLGHACSDTNFETAVAALEASTAAIDKQSALLEVQKKALLDLQGRRGSDGRTSMNRDRLLKRYARETTQADFEIDELSSSLHALLQTSSSQTEALLTSLPKRVGKLLEKDDRLLDGLQKLEPKLLNDGRDDELVGEVDRLCQVFMALESNTIRARMDNAYRSGLRERSAQPNGQCEEDLTNENEREAVRAELEELCGEIDGLLGMLVEHQYRNPISRALNATRTEAEAERVTWSTYLVDTLRYLIARLEALDDLQQHTRASQSALRAISAALAGVLQQAESTQNDHTSGHAAPKAAQKGLKPLRLVQANLSESFDPAAQLLRQLDVQNVDPADTVKLAQTLEEVVQERREKLDSQTRSLDGTIADQLSSSIMSADCDLASLLGAVYAHSTFGSIRLADEALENDLERLEQKTQVLGDGMRELDVEQIAKEVKNGQLELLQGWRK